MTHRQNNNIVNLFKKWKVKGKGTVRNQIIEGNAKTLGNKRLRNRRIIEKLIKSVYFMTKKHWAAHRNLTDFAKFLGNQMEESVIQYHLDSMAKNATYVSPESADEFLDAINTHLKNKLSEELDLTTKFTLEADQSTNVTDKEALNIFLRYVCPISNELKHRYLCQVSVPTKRAPDIRDKVLEVFAEKGIDAKKIFFNGFDGTNTMSGERGGLQRYMRNESPFSKYINFRSHRFALVFKHLMTRYQILSSLDSLLLQLRKTFKFSTNNKAVLDEIQKEEGKTNTLKMLKACVTR